MIAVAVIALITSITSLVIGIISLVYSVKNYKLNHTHKIQILDVQTSDHEVIVKLQNLGLPITNAGVHLVADDAAIDLECMEAVPPSIAKGQIVKFVLSKRYFKRAMLLPPNAFINKSRLERFFSTPIFMLAITSNGNPILHQDISQQYSEKIRSSCTKMQNAVTS